MAGSEGHTFDLTQSFPSLRTLTMSGPTGISIPVNFAHETLQDFRLIYFTYSPLQFSRLLQNMPNLETLRLYKCTAQVGVNVEESEIPPYVHQRLHSITFSRSVPVEWFQALTCPSVGSLQVDGEFGFANSYSDAGRRLSKLITTSLPSDELSVVALARSAVSPTWIP
ncbi:hypothetical protein BKA70DRAFT_1400434 [Coprinopsis sp. MPI-PUGE-AT-0042]|nr:hypothetical protein BKA70DRAFT_1400434 [Coprinopsis sp. MPI-PUGE-AT-0042]